MKSRYFFSAIFFIFLVLGSIASCQPNNGNTPTKNLEITVPVQGYGELTISAPHNYKNMTLFFISQSNPKQTAPKEYISLAEGLSKKLVIVSEKEYAEVDTLQVENLSDKPLFIQAGEVVKGGQQDRTIQTSLIVPPKSGKYDIPSLCVEQSRWSGDAEFLSTNHSANNKELKMAIQKGEQGQVWDEVAKVKERAQDITETASETSSLNEELDNDKFRQTSAQYVQALENLLSQYPSAIGLAYACSGKIYTIDIFSSHYLLEKSFSKLLTSYTNESVLAEPEENPAISNTSVKDFIIAMEKGEIKTRTHEKNYIQQVENSVGFTSEVIDEDKKVIHRQYLGK